jgi:hypothetical protein
MKKQERMTMRITIFLLTTLSVAGLAQAASHKLHVELQGVASDASVDVIVKYREAPTAAHQGKILARGGELKGNLEIIRAAHYSIAARDLEELSN